MSMYGLNPNTPCGIDSEEIRYILPSNFDDPGNPLGSALAVGELGINLLQTWRAFNPPKKDSLPDIVMSQECLSNFTSPPLELAVHPLVPDFNIFRVAPNLAEKAFMALYGQKKGSCRLPDADLWVHNRFFAQVVTEKYSAEYFSDAGVGDESNLVQHLVKISSPELDVHVLVRSNLRFSSTVLIDCNTGGISSPALEVLPISVDAIFPLDGELVRICLMPPSTDLEVRHIALWGTNPQNWNTYFHAHVLDFLYSIYGSSTGGLADIVPVIPDPNTGPVLERALPMPKELARDLIYE